MDRMASSMKQVPNPLPKVLSRRGVGAGLEAAERESFERTQVRSGDPGASLGHLERRSVRELLGPESRAWRPRRGRDKAAAASKMHLKRAQI